MSQAAGGTPPVVSRSSTQSPLSGAIPDEDISGTTSLLLERLRAWKHAVVYLEDYVSVTEKVEKSHAKEYERVLKSISEPLRESHQFALGQGGLAGMLESMRLNTQGIATSHLEAEKNLHQSVLPILRRLHDEIKAKEKETVSTAGKGSKSVDKARTSTQSHIDALGQHTAVVSVSASKVEPQNDPYVLQRGLYHRLQRQINEENSSRQEILQVQDQFAQFEAHVLQTIQQAMSSFVQFVAGQAERKKAMYSDMQSNVQKIPLDFEWISFLHRHDNVLMDPNSSARRIENVTFPGQNHATTVPLIEGTLERKSRLLVKSSSGHYVVTPARYLHEYKDTEDFKKDPTPELSLYLPDCTVSTAPDGPKFSVRGKDASKKLGMKIGTSHDLSFKAASAAEAQRWCEVIRTVAGGSSDQSEPSSPIDSRTVPANVGTSAPGSQAAGIIAPAENEKKTPISAVGATPIIEKPTPHPQSELPIREDVAGSTTAAPVLSPTPAVITTSTIVEGQVSGVTKGP